MRYAIHVRRACAAIAWFSPESRIRPCHRLHNVGARVPPFFFGFFPSRAVEQAMSRVLLANDGVRGWLQATDGPVCPGFS